MSTNPFCCVVPRTDGSLIVLDMAASTIAQGKARVACMKGVEVPDGALIDHTGLATNDSEVMFEEPFGSLGLFGAHKGYGLAVMCELLGGRLDTFQQEVAAMVDYLHSTTPATGMDQVRVPGDPERESVATRGTDGILIDENSWKGILKAAEVAGASETEIAALTD